MTRQLKKKTKTAMRRAQGVIKLDNVPTCSLKTLFTRSCVHNMSLWVREPINLLLRPSSSDLSKVHVG